MGLGSRIQGCAFSVLGFRASVVFRVREGFGVHSLGFRVWGRRHS